MQQLAINSPLISVQTFRYISRCLVIIALFALPLSRTVMSYCLFGAAFISLFVIDWQQLWSQLREKSFLLLSLALIICYTIGIFYSQASWHYALQVYSRYSKLLFLPLFLPLFVDSSWRKFSFYSFIAGTTVLVSLGYIDYFSWVKIAQFGTSHPLSMNAIDASFVVAIASYISFQLFISDKNKGFLFLAAFLLGYLFTQSVERTGYLLAFTLVGLLLWQHFRGKGFTVALFGLPSVFLGLYWFLPSFQIRVHEMVNQLFQGGEDYAYHSIQYRKGFAKYSWQAFKQHPIVGNGTGSFREVYANTGGPQLGNKLLSHPHNEYIMVAFQLGVLGLIIFLAWLASGWLNALKLPAFERRITQALIVAFAALSVCNASLYVSAAGSAFVILAAILLATSNQEQQ